MTITHSGSFKNLERFFANAKKMKINSVLAKYGVLGVTALANATPKDSAVTAVSWDYVIETTSYGYSIGWFNTNVNNGAVIAVLIQFGHGTGTGGYVQPVDYINPAMRGLFDKISEALSREVSSL